MPSIPATRLKKGMLVKMESSSDGEPKMSTKMAVTEIKTP